MKGFLAGIGVFSIVVALVGASLGAVALGWGIQWFTAPIRGAVGAREIIQADPTFRIQAYTKFYNDCASIQALEGDIDAQLTTINLVSGRDREIVTANVTALTAARAGAIFRYNQDSHKQWTEAQFKSTALPYELATGEYVKFLPDGSIQKGVKTQCAI